VGCQDQHGGPSRGHRQEAWCHSPLGYWIALGDGGGLCDTVGVIPHGRKGNGLLRTFGERQIMAQLIVRRGFVSPLIHKGFRVCHPRLARGNYAPCTPNHQKCARALMCPNPYRRFADTPHWSARRVGLPAADRGELATGRVEGPPTDHGEIAANRAEVAGHQPPEAGEIVPPPHHRCRSLYSTAARRWAKPLSPLGVRPLAPSLSAAPT
jgi:hypothetical protein